jgi:hypothetical protein
MGKPRDTVKERYWRQLIRRQSGSRLGTRDFCEREGVCQQQFYSWRRTLRERDRHPLCDRRRARTKRPGEDQRSKQAESPFLALPLPTSFGTAIEVVHPRGHVLRIPACFDATALRRILATLDTPVDLSGEQS